MTTGRYTSYDALKGKYPETQKSIAQSAVSSYFIANTEDELDSRVAMRYSVPFSAPIPGMIQDLATDLVYYKLTIRSDQSENLKTYIDERIKGIIDGTIVLVSSGTSLQVAANGAWISSSYSTSFGMDSDVNWRVDPDLIDDTSAGRR
jgi:hypothetical protein